MSTPLRPVVTAFLLAAVSLLVYATRPGALPATDEAVFAQQAQSAFSHPQMFFHVQDERWLQPMAVYATAIVRTLGGGEASGRIASAMAGAINVGLIFVVARLLFSQYWLALSTAVILLSMPAHWWFARLGTDAIFSTPFVLLWLIAILRFLENDSPKALWAAGAALGVGMLAHPAAPLTMAWLWLASLVAMVMTRRIAAHGLFALAALFAGVIGLLAVYYLQYPETYPDTFGRWAVLKAHLRFPLDGLRAQVNWTTLANRASLFWGFLDPSHLFFPANGQQIAPVLFASALLIPLGVVRALALPRPAHRLLLFSVLLVPPGIASTFGVAHDMGSAVPMTIGLTLVSGAGLEWLMTRSIAWRVAAAAAAIVSVYQLTWLL